MELYETLAAWAGWPAIVAFLLLVGGFGYWIFQNRIEMLNDKNDYLAKQVNDLKEFHPDLIIKRLANRLKLANEELERLLLDEENNRELIKQKEEDVRKTISDFQELQVKLSEMESVIRNYDTVINDFHLTEFVSWIQYMFDEISLTLSIIESRRSNVEQGKLNPIPDWEEKLILDLLFELVNCAADNSTPANVLSLVSSTFSENAKKYLESIDSMIKEYAWNYMRSPKEDRVLPSYEEISELKRKLSKIQANLFSP